METKIRYDIEALHYIAKIANGGMRDAITMLDKCLAYSEELTLDNVLKALGLSDYDTMTDLLCAIEEEDIETQIKIINTVYMSGKDLKQFIKDFTNFVLDCSKYALGIDSSYLSCPATPEILTIFVQIHKPEELLKSLIKLQTDIKWDTNPRARIEAWCFVKE